LVVTSAITEPERRVHSHAPEIGFDVVLRVDHGSQTHVPVPGCSCCHEIESALWKLADAIASSCDLPATRLEITIHSRRAPRREEPTSLGLAISVRGRSGDRVSHVEPVARARRQVGSTLSLLGVRERMF
jgi:hypothetical protein